MKVILTLITLTLTFLYVTGVKEEQMENIENKTDTGIFFGDSQEVPDSSLMLFDGLDLNHATTKEYYARKIKRKLPKQNSTTTTTPASTSSRRCQCAAGICKCCTGFFLDLFDQKACLKVTYHPGDFAFDVAMSMNDRILYENSLSGKNPKPICISPPRLSNIKVCAKIYDVFFPGRNFHFCLSMIGKWGSNELFNLSFDCLRMGANGIVKLKPEDEGGLTITDPQGGVDAVIDSGDDIEEYDENVVRSLLEIFER